MANGFKIGYARVDATPKLGVNLAGYFVERIADKVLDPLSVCALAAAEGENTVVLLTIDLCSVATELTDEYRGKVACALNIPVSAVIIHCIHSHTSPIINPGCNNPLNLEYRDWLSERLVEAARAAVADLADAKMGVGEGEARNVAFIRRYRMKDGSVKTNPGVNNSEIVEPIGKTDERVGVLRFDRDGRDSVVLVNFANHADVVGGCNVSADWPGLTRTFVEKSIDGVKCIVLNGAEGDVNHVNVHPKAGDFNDLFNDFDGCSRGYGHARHIARVITGAVLSVFDKVEYVECAGVEYLEAGYDIASNKPRPEDMPLARKYHELHLAGRDDEIPYTDMMLTTVVAEAGRMVRLENAPDAFNMRFTAFKIGAAMLFAIPGEPFTGVGRGIKDRADARIVMPMCLANGNEGYFPMQDSYDEGGYEARSSRYKAGVAERIIEIGNEMLSALASR